MDPWPSVAMPAGFSAPFFEGCHCWSRILSPRSTQLSCKLFRKEFSNRFMNTRQKKHSVSTATQCRQYISLFDCYFIPCAPKNQPFSSLLDAKNQTDIRLNLSAYITTLFWARFYCPLGRFFYFLIIIDFFSCFFLVVLRQNASSVPYSWSGERTHCERACMTIV